MSSDIAPTPSEDKSADSARAGETEAMAFDYWAGRMEEWVAAVVRSASARRRVANLQGWSFPTDDVRDAYLTDIANRDVDEIMTILRSFLSKENRLEWI